MLIEFNIKNFKSFYNNTNISMVADNMKREKKDRLFKIAGNSKTEKNILPSMVIYGANASGKTNIISAFQLLREIIVNGTIKPEINNSIIDEIEIDSFIHDAKKMKETIEFNITFKTDMYVYNYILKIIPNIPITKEERIISAEELNIVEYKVLGTSIQENKLNLFKRNKNEIVLNKENIIKILKIDNNYLEPIEEILSQNMDKQDLFLTTGFKSNISLKVATDVIQWFQEYLLIVLNFSNYKLLITSKNNENNIILFNGAIEKLTKMADFGPQKIALVKNKNKGNYELTSIYEPKGVEGGIIVESKSIESKGTMKLLEFWMPFLKYFKKGATFILDEFDSSIHPELIGGILDLFNNPEINKAHSQIIFNTHNPIYLQKRFFRRDQIMFVDKDEETYISSVYKLSDFNLRTDNNYMNKYFEGEFGALPYIDFASIIEGNSKEGDEVENQ